MTRQIIEKIEQKMCEHLTEAQKGILHDTLVHCMMEETAAEASADTQSYLKIFLAAKRVEGCSEKTIRYYDSTIRNVLTAIGKEVKMVTTDDLRVYLDEYQKRSNASKVTIDNIRRILSSFFAWLEDENYITKSPVRRIHKVKTCKTVKETYSDEALELMRDHCDGIRDLAIIDMLLRHSI